ALTGAKIEQILKTHSESNVSAVAGLSADSNKQGLEEWIKKENFLNFSVEDRLVLLEKVIRQNGGENIFVASMNSLIEEVSVKIAEFSVGRKDLKTFLETLRMKPKFHVSEKIKITSDVVFTNCTLVSMVENLCRKYQLKAFYYDHELYLIPLARANID
ncbi:MAG: hypothetical protein PHV05_11995, partial [Candidatus Riflebacteria bacterium]|nr:hypothetical protein [Candidatus Riflebacteria bacterium]